jgi:hypothetical protein
VIVIVSIIFRQAMDVVRKNLNNGVILMMFSDCFDGFVGELVFRIKVVKSNKFRPTGTTKSGWSTKFALA